MPVDMATDKVRLVLQTDEELRAALRLEAARRTAHGAGEEITMSDVANAILREALAETIEEIRHRRHPESKRKSDR